MASDPLDDFVAADRRRMAAYDAYERACQELHAATAEYRTARQAWEEYRSGYRVLETP